MCVCLRGATTRWIFRYLQAFRRLLHPFLLSPLLPQRHTQSPIPLSSLQVLFEQAKQRVIAQCPTSPGLVIWQLF